jgi:predicted ArsR family transcriptional regulator
VLRLLSQGVNRVTIARRMNLSINTVRTHLRHLMGKLGVNTELAAAARGRELLETAQRPSQKRWTTEDAPIDLRAYELKDRLGS